MTGLFLKPACGLLSLILSCMAGLCFVVLLKKSKIPFGPAISIAVCITLLYGSDVVAWYLGLFF
jgi:leader peptidase (prepilin peptidase)/N-methyltransferase